MNRKYWFVYLLKCLNLILQRGIRAVFLLDERMRKEEKRREEEIPKEQFGQT